MNGREGGREGKPGQAVRRGGSRGGEDRRSVAGSADCRWRDRGSVATNVGAAS